MSPDMGQKKLLGIEPGSITTGCGAADAAGNGANGGGADDAAGNGAGKLTS